MATLADYIPKEGELLDQETMLSAFLEYVTDRGITLYPAQEEAILELLAGKHVILSTPTGSGKSLVAEALHFKGLAEGKRSFYTSPIKALVNEKFFALCEIFGPENVGMITGDAAVNQNARIICCTAEILANLALREDGDTIDYVVMDEFHYYADPERGVAWQIPLLSLQKAAFLLMSATLGPTEAIERRLKEFTGREVAVVGGLIRPVPLEYEYSERPIHETIAWLMEQDRAPVYIVNFTQKGAAEMAQGLTCVNLCTKQEKQAIREAMRGVRFSTPYGRDIEKFLQSGIGIHHAGILPRYRRLTERLAQKGLLKVICGTDTLGMGINIPLRTVLFTRLCKFDGDKVGIVKVRDFRQIAGRAGRKGFDDVGYVVVQAPEHVIENLRMAAKMGGRKFVKKQAPTKGYAHWDKNTFERLRTAAAEPLESRFDVTFSMMLSLLQSDEVWPKGGYGRLIELIGRSHGSDASKRALRRKAAMQFRALQEADIVHVLPYPEGRGAFVEVSGDLQRDFSLYQSLSLFLLAAISTLDPTSENYALDLLSFVEATLETPTAILQRQLDKLKTERMAELKAAGVPYEERIAELEKVQAPAPLSGEIYGMFSAFRHAHPWVAFEAIRPKSIVRDMFERMALFNDYVIEYGLQRSEGILLRYLSDCYKALVHTVPEAQRTETVDDIICLLGDMIRQVDSSLVDEWEALCAGVSEEVPHAEVESLLPADPVARPPEDLLELAKSPRAFAARIRREMHALLAALSRKNWAAAAACIANGISSGISSSSGEQAPQATNTGEAGDSAASENCRRWDEASLERALTPWFETYGAIDATPRARMPEHTVIRAVPGKNLFWEVCQTIMPPVRRTASLEEELEAAAEEGTAEENGLDARWTLVCTVNLTSLGAATSGGQTGPIIELESIGEC